MAALKSNSLNKWRDYFRTANSDIFDIIQYGIIVAASDCPKEFRIRRDGIAETLFSCRLTKCLGCDHVELAVPEGGGDVDVGGDEGCKGGFVTNGCEGGFVTNGCEFEVAGGSKGSNVNSSGGDDEDDDEGDDRGERNTNQVSNYSYDAAEALTDEIEEEAQICGEVMRIKEIIENIENETDSVLYESLRKLQLMALSVESLKETWIGKAVNPLRKHPSKEISHLAKTLIVEWKAVADAWANANLSVEASEATPESMNPSVLDEEEEGLPSPPLDDLAFLSSTMELSQFFDGMEDFGNPRNSVELKKNRENGRKPPLESNHSIPQRKPQRVQNEPAVTPPKERKVEQTKKQEPLMKKQSSVVRPNKPQVAESGPGRPVKPIMEQTAHNMNKHQQKQKSVTVARRPLASEHNKLRCSDKENQSKLEASKRKLQESYQQFANAKKQRTIQVMELHDLPKQSLGHRNPHIKPGSNNRQWANGRR